MNAPTFCLSLDLGQKRDFSTVVILERAWLLQGVWTYLSDQEDDEAVTTFRSEAEDRTVFEGEPFPLKVLYLDRWARGTSYVDIVKDTGRLLGALLVHSPEDASLVIDATGLGAVVMDMFKRKRGLPPPVGITITGAATVTQRGPRDLLVPKVDLIRAAIGAVETHRVTWPTKLPLRGLLESELKAFERTYTESGHARMEAGSGAHDDLVLAFAQACWYFTVWNPSHHLWVPIQ